MLAKKVPLHNLIQLTPRAYKTDVKYYKADIPAVSTWRPKGSAAVHQESPAQSPPVESEGMRGILP